MAFAEGSQVYLQYVQETTWGTTPGTPTCKLIDFVSESLALTKDSLESKMIRSDRNIAYHLSGNKQVSGDINAELVYGMFDPFLESALYNSFSSNVLKNGVTEKSFTVERGLLDISKYFVYTGLVVNSMKLSIKPNTIVEVTFSFIGKSETVATSSIDSTREYATGIGTNPMDSFQGTLSEGGSSISIVTGLELEVNNQISNEGFVIGSDSRVALFDGRCRVTGTLSCYVGNTTLYSKFVNGSESSISVNLKDAANNQYSITLPRVKYTGATANVGGEGPIVSNMPFQALYSSANACTISITRTPAS